MQERLTKMLEEARRLIAEARTSGSGSSARRVK